MAYDTELADRVREQLAGEGAVSEQAMFGGLAFMLQGNIAGLNRRHPVRRAGPPVGPP
jgi:TfoX/Sxy family transcriptional regulator of competence genes